MYVKESFILYYVNIIKAYNSYHLGILKQVLKDGGINSLTQWLRSRSSNLTTAVWRCDLMEGNTRDLSHL